MGQKIRSFDQTNIFTRRTEARTKAKVDELIGNLERQSSSLEDLNQRIYNTYENNMLLFNSINLNKQTSKSI